MGRTAGTEPRCLYNGALYGPYGRYRASVRVQRCTLWAVWPVQSLGACTTVHFMGRTAGTEPQCVYNGALYNIKKQTYTRIRDLILIQSIDFELVLFSV
jgi:hypothetical protein